MPAPQSHKIYRTQKGLKWTIILCAMFIYGMWLKGTGINLLSALLGLPLPLFLCAWVYAYKVEVLDEGIRVRSVFSKVFVRFDEVTKCNIEYVYRGQGAKGRVLKLHTSDATYLELNDNFLGKDNLAEIASILREQSRLEHASTGRQVLQDFLSTWQRRKSGGRD